MPDVMLQIRQLLALVADKELEEGRTAAYAAARLILKHNIVLMPPPRGAPVTFPAPKVDTSKIVKKKAAAPAEPKAPWRDMSAKFETKCKYCDKGIRKDQPIKWARSKGAYHPVCYVEMMKQRAAE